MVTFTPGELFDSFEDLQQKLFDYSEENFCHFYVKDSKKLTNDETVNSELIYRHIAFSCIYGGQKARFRGTGNRSVTSIRHGCTAGLYLRCTKDRLHLQVRSFVDTHNHEVSEELFRSASQDRKLPWDLKAEVEELLLLGADKDRLVEYIRLVSNKTLDKKHLFNLYETAVKHQREITRERACMLIQKAYGVETEEEADVILSQLLEVNKQPRRRRTMQEPDDSVEYTYINEGEEEEAVGEEMGEELRRLMGTLEGSDHERIVIVQGDEQYEVIEADQDVEEYLDDEDREGHETRQGRTVIKKERLDDSPPPAKVARTAIKRPAPTVLSKARPASKTVQQYESPTKSRAVALYNNNVSSVDDDPLSNNHELNDLRLSVLRAEQDKLVAEQEMIKLQRNKLVRDIAQSDLEKSKLYMEIDLFKLQKKHLQDQQETTQLTNEKLRLEIAKLKGETETAITESAE